MEAAASSGYPSRLQNGDVQRLCVCDLIRATDDRLAGKVARIGLSERTLAPSTLNLAGRRSLLTPLLFWENRTEKPRICSLDPVETLLAVRTTYDWNQ